MSRRTVVVTGAAHGIGRATAEVFAAAGFDVAALDLDVAGLEGLPARVCGRLDVTDPDGWRRALEEVRAATGRLDVLVNNAGVLVTGPLGELDPLAQARVVDVNVKGVLFGCAAALPDLRRTPGSCVVNVSSASALYGQPGLAVYSATKSAVGALTEALDLEWEPYGISVVDVLPLFVRTAMGEQVSGLGTVRSLGVRLGPDDVARAVLRAALDGRSIVRGPHRAVGWQARALQAGGRVAVPAVVRGLVQALSR